MHRGVTFCGVQIHVHSCSTARDSWSEELHQLSDKDDNQEIAAAYNYDVSYSRRATL